MSHLPDVYTHLSQMSPDQKIGQLFIFTWRNLAQAENELKLYPAGFIRIYSDAMTVARETEAIQALAGGGLTIAADLERGIGGTICGALEVTTAMALGATRDPKCAYDAGFMIGSEAAAMGINMNFAPVLDTNSNPLNPVINTRSFGSDPTFVGEMGAAFARGLNKAGVASCGKHFPGHGDAGFDSHSSLGSINADGHRLNTMELVPFKAAISQGLDAIMSAHLLIPAIEPDSIPATLSRRVMTELLREELGFTGVAITDALDMGAIANHFPPEIAIPKAINAGCDQLIMPKDPEAAVDIVRHAIKTGNISEQRLNECVSRILKLKSKYKSLPDPTNLPAKVSVPAYIERAAEIAKSSITLVKSNGQLPLKKTQKIFCLSFNNGSDGRAYYLEPSSFADFLIAEGFYVTSYMAGDLECSPSLPDHVLEMAASADVIILAAYINVRLHSGTIAMAESVVNELQPLTRLNKPTILVSFGNPYIGNQLPAAETFICAYSATQPSQKAVANCLYSGIFNGKIPVQLN